MSFFRKNINKLKKHQSKALVLMDQMWISGCHFLIAVLLARWLGIKTFGVFAFIWMILLFASSLHQSFISIPMMTFAPAKSEIDQQSYFNNLLILQLTTTFIAFLFGLIFCTTIGYFLPEWSLKSIALPTAFFIPAYLMHDFLRKYYYTKSKVTFAFGLDLLAYIPQLLIIIGLYLSNNLTLYNTISGISFGYILSALVFILSPLFKQKAKPSAFLQTMSEHWTFSKWLIGKSLLQWFSGNSFILAAGAIYGPVAMGGIRIAQNVIGVLNILFIALENYLPIQASKQYSRNGINALVNYLKTISFKGGAFTLLTTIIIIIFASPILNIIYGESNAESTFLLQGFAVLYFFVFIALPLRMMLRTIGETKYVFYAYTISTAFSISLAYPMVKSWGLTGVIIGLVTAQLLMQFFYLIVIKPLVKSNQKISKIQNSNI